MNKAILKFQWERYKTHIDLDISTAAHLLAPYSKDTIEQVLLLSEGCANTNYKVIFKNEKPPVVIRIYVRDKAILKLEMEVHQLVAEIIPIPRYIYGDNKCRIYPYPYAIIEWVDGKLMRDVIFTEDEQAIAQCAFDAGKYLSKLRQLHFSQSGFFEEHLHIRPFNQNEEYLPFVLTLLEEDIVKESLSDHLYQATSKLVVNHSHLLSKNTEANLTHGDYDPANILVKKVAEKWKIVAILDWEFAYAGTYLLDIGLMLRYSHKLPSCYEEKFIEGIQLSSEPLPFHWKKQAKLMDLLCLLQLIHYDPLRTRPKMNSDIVSLIIHIVDHWHLF